MVKRVVVGPGAINGAHDNVDSYMAREVIRPADVITSRPLTDAALSFDLELELS